MGEKQSSPVSPAAQEALQQIMDQTYEIVTRDYLCELDRADRYELCSPSYQDLDLDLAENARFFRLDRLVLNRPESFLECLSTVLSVASIVQGSVTAVFHSDGKEKTFYLGVISKRFRGRAWASRRQSILKAVSGALEGNLSGSIFTPVEDPASIIDLISGPAAGAVCAVSGIPALKNDLEQRTYLQGLERLDDALRGLRYSVMYIADPASPEDISRIRQGYETLYSQLSPFAGIQFSHSTDETQTLSESQARTLTRSLSQSLGLTQSTGTSTGRTNSTHAGINANIGFGVPGVISGGVGGTLGFAWAASTTYSSGIAHQKILNRTDSEADMQGSARSKGTTEGVAVQFSLENRTVKSLMERISRHLERLERCENTGAMQAAAYIIAPDQDTAVTVAGNYSALLRGNQSGEERAYLNIWDETKAVSLLTEYLTHAMHPRFKRKNDESPLFISPVTLLHSQEAAQQLFFPQTPMDGIPVLHMAPFGRNVPSQSGNGVPFGTLTYLGKSQDKPVCLDLKQLTAHTFITGSTGAGKSNAVYTLLEQLCLKQGSDTKFLVIEPAKGEYKEALGGCPGVQVYGTNPQKAPLLRLNPFSFPEDTHVLEHIDRLVEIFNACWPMYAAMPAVLKTAVEQAYKDCGWSLNSSACAEKRIFPTFREVMRALPAVVDNKGFSNDTQGDYKGALLTRLESLTNGINGQVLCAYNELPVEELFDRNVIIDLSRVGSSETKALLMGILILKLQEHRMAQRAAGIHPSNSVLQHITVLEEAHNLLRRTSLEQSQESANLQGKSVEMLTNAIAEMRTYGEGFLIVDQSPGLLDRAVIRNTNTKIILRLPDEEDRMLVGRAAGLNDEQIVELSHLDTGIAAVYQNHWLEPVLCKIPYFDGEKKCKPFSYRNQETDDPAASFEEYIFEALLQNGPDDIWQEREHVDQIKSWIERQETGSEVKKLLYQALIDRKLLSEQDKRYALYCLTRGKHLIMEARRTAVTSETAGMVIDMRIMERFSVSERTARKVRGMVLLYAADHIHHVDEVQYHELREIGGVQ